MKKGCSFVNLTNILSSFNPLYKLLVRRVRLVLLVDLYIINLFNIEVNVLL